MALTSIYPPSMGTDITDALVNKPVDERQTPPALWRKYYGTWWDGQQLPDALKIYGLVWQRQVDVWDQVNDQPAEQLAVSVTYSRFNSWTAGGTYIFDTLYSTGDPNKADGAAPGEPGYRPQPGMPGYTGPYWTHV